MSTTKTTEAIITLRDATIIRVMRRLVCGDYVGDVGVTILTDEDIIIAGSYYSYAYDDLDLVSDCCGVSPSWADTVHDDVIDLLSVSRDEARALWGMKTP